jgi:hypothetical protein
LPQGQQSDDQSVIRDGQVFYPAQNTSRIYVQAGLKPNVAAMDDAMETVKVTAKRVAEVRTPKEFGALVRPGYNESLSKMLDDKLTVQLSLGEIGGILATAEGSKLTQQWIFSTNPLTNTAIPRGSFSPFVTKLPAVLGMFRSNADHELECSPGGCDLYFQKK